MLEIMCNNIVDITSSLLTLIFDVMFRLHKSLQYIRNL